MPDELEARRLAPATINLRLAAVRRLATRQANPRPRCPYHFGQDCMIYPRYHGFG
jgi:hypothetical protein